MQAIPFKRLIPISYREGGEALERAARVAPSRGCSVPGSQLRLPGLEPAGPRAPPAARLRPAQPLGAVLPLQTEALCTQSQRIHKTHNTQTVVLLELRKWRELWSSAKPAVQQSALGIASHAQLKGNGKFFAIKLPCFPSTGWDVT